jgi:hypothetical protein
MVLLFLARLVSNLSSLVTMLVFLMTTTDATMPFATGRVIAATMVTIVVLCVVIWDGSETWKQGARLYGRTFRRGPDGDKGIREYMVKWISQGGRTAIVSRNLTWVEDGPNTPTRKLLIDRARAGDLAVYVPEDTSVASALKKDGATVTVFGNPATRTRFTIINDGRADARVAIGADIDGKHVIREYGAGDPVLMLAQDLVAILSRP